MQDAALRFWGRVALVPQTGIRHRPAPRPAASRRDTAWAARMLCDGEGARAAAADEAPACAARPPALQPGERLPGERSRGEIIQESSE